MRRATIRSELDDASVIARAIRPDNTDEMDTRVETDEDGTPTTVVTEIERETTGGLRTNVDDYVVNVDVATRVAQHAHRHTNTQS
ncbi:KEOPS complex subunit Pcc1 [Natronoarchaeum rubrum]|uniref:KEOPS complex subunit Pcc1 n=1 Tax=Natronoarchaeum rubrum TaxID=755311 RepID=UPI0021129EA6|nr:KEOPS complex subunit Pcc1 [Natronoarchaeum rubrum]HMB51574.1 KEOPS complex subunit Pcc1 [Natronoarchaeum rubrum]